MWRRRRKQNVGLSKKCDRWAMKFYMAGHGANSKRRRKNTRRRRERIGRKKNALLVHPSRESPNCRTDFYARPTRAGDSAVFEISTSGMPWLFGRAATSNHGLWCGRAVHGSRGKVAGTLRDRNSREHGSNVHV